MCVYVYGVGVYEDEEGAIIKPSIGEVGTKNPNLDEMRLRYSASPY
jgi:hypothetical protein